MNLYYRNEDRESDELRRKVRKGKQKVTEAGVIEPWAHWLYRYVVYVYSKYTANNYMRTGSKLKQPNLRIRL